MIKEAIKNNFSKFASHYDKYSTVQSMCAVRLIEKINEEGFRKILDIGCGTGNYTALLKERFPEARIKAVDISKEMIDIARTRLGDRRAEFIVADAETEDFKEDFDLITSNVSFQWFQDLRKALSRYASLLGNEGVILFSTFGPLTFHELQDSVNELLGEGKKISACNFAEKKNIESILRGLFRESHLEERTFTDTHASLQELLNRIKYTGTRGAGIFKSLWTPRLLRSLEDVYRKKFSEGKKIKVTYQVFFCKGIK